MSECIAYRSASLTCSNGFMQKPFCRGYGGCHSCGHISEKATPHCLRDELPAHMVKPDGSPAFYQEPHP